MSQLADLYKTSTKPHVVEARNAPGQDVNFFDREKAVQGAFKPDEMKGDQTQFSEAAQNEYDKEVSQITPPPSYDPAFPLHRYTEKTPFFAPGQPKSA